VEGGDELGVRAECAEQSLILNECARPSPFLGGGETAFLGLRVGDRDRRAGLVDSTGPASPGTARRRGHRRPLR
jgi:hypothetical protein